VEIGWKGERVNMPRLLVARIEERRFSRTRTILMEAAMATGSLLAREAFWGPAGASGGTLRRPAPFRADWRNGAESWT